MGRKLFIIIVLLLMSGCGNVAERNTQIALNNALIVASLKDQSVSIAEHRSSTLIAMAKAAVAAAKTLSPADDVTVAFLSGYTSGRREKVVVPKLQAPAKEKDTADYMAAFVPYANMINPWMYGALGNNKKETSTSLTAGEDIFYIGGDSGSFDYSPYTDTSSQLSISTTTGE